MIIFLTYDIEKLLFSICHFFCFWQYTSLHKDLPRTSLGVFLVTSPSNSDVAFNIACELSQLMGKTEFSSFAKN